MYLDTTDKAPIPTVLSQDDVVSPDEVPTTSYPSPQSKRKRDESVTIETGASTTRDSPPHKKRSTRISKWKKATLVKCKICQKPYQDTEMANTGNVWIGCSQPKCNVWVHTKCEGFVGKTEQDFSTLKYFCINHRNLK